MAADMTELAEQAWSLSAGDSMALFLITIAVYLLKKLSGRFVIGKLFD